MDFPRLRNFLLSSGYSVFNSTVTYILCAITLLLYSNNFIFSVFHFAVYFLFNSPLVGYSGNDIAFGVGGKGSTFKPIKSCTDSVAN